MRPGGRRRRPESRSAVPNLSSALLLPFELEQTGLTEHHGQPLLGLVHEGGLQLDADGAATDALGYGEQGPGPLTGSSPSVW